MLYKPIYPYDLPIYKNGSIFEAVAVSISLWTMGVVGLYRGALDGGGHGLAHRWL